jgi:heavy metal translocating P-type ATPase
VLDKTGTLTTGKPAVTDILPGDLDQEELVLLAAALEERSEHPFAKAILAYASERKLRFESADDFESIPGRGVSAVVDGIRVYGGNRRLMEEIGVDVPDQPQLSRQGKTPLYFGNELGQYLGSIAAADVLKTDSAEAVGYLQSLGLSVVMLTGDNHRTAQAIAAEAGIDRVVADVLPADKAAAIQQLQSEGHKVAMVGDGINDAPALACADVGIAIGAGTDIAMESADVVLMSGSLKAISTAVELSRATIRNIRQNLFWAFFYNSLGIPVAAGVLYPAFGLQLSPMLGAAAMSLSSVFVVTNALRLRFFRPKTAASVQFTQISESAAVAPAEMVIRVGGMMCPHCQAAVEKACKEVPGTQDAVVNLQEKTVTVLGEAGRSDLEKAIVAAGYELI